VNFQLNLSGRVLKEIVELDKSLNNFQSSGRLGDCCGFSCFAVGLVVGYFRDWRNGNLRFLAGQKLSRGNLGCRTFDNLEDVIGIDFDSVVVMLALQSFSSAGGHNAGLAWRLRDIIALFFAAVDANDLVNVSNHLCIFDLLNVIVRIDLWRNHR
jgi:hypothetical protein